MAKGPGRRGKVTQVVCTGKRHAMGCGPDCAARVQIEGLSVVDVWCWSSGGDCGGESLGMPLLDATAKSGGVPWSGVLGWVG